VATLAEEDIDRICEGDLLSKSNLFWRLCLLTACLATSSASTPAFASEPHHKPRIRTVTAFIRIDPAEYDKQIAETVAMLRQAKTAFEKGGYEVETVRITTQPFSKYLGGRSPAEALGFIQKLDELSKKDSFMLNIGPLAAAESSDAANVELLGEILAHTRVHASVVVADENGVQWNAIGAAAQVMKYLEDHSPNGANNFDFAAAAMVPTNVPFFPASNHDGPGHQFSIGWEAGAFVQEVFAGASRNMQLAKELLSKAFEQQAQVVDGIATEVEKKTGWKYMGLDTTPAPNTDSSIGAAIETLIGAKFGSSGTLSAAAVITAAERSISLKRAGYSGLMLPILEDPVLAERWSEGTFDLDSLLAYSMVCGTGLDAVPLPGDISQQQLERIIGDMASLAFKWHKPLTARLIPAPAKKAGEKTDFDFGIAFPNTTLRAVR
jgi:uncharacterized protein